MILTYIFYIDDQEKDRLEFNTVNQSLDKTEYNKIVNQLRINYPIGKIRILIQPNKDIEIIFYREKIRLFELMEKSINIDNCFPLENTVFDLKLSYCYYIQNNYQNGNKIKIKAIRYTESSVWFDGLQVLKLTSIKDVKDLRDFSISMTENKIYMREVTATYIIGLKLNDESVTFSREICRDITDNDRKIIDQLLPIVKELNQMENLITPFLEIMNPVEFEFDEETGEMTGKLYRRTKILTDSVEWVKTANKMLMIDHLPSIYKTSRFEQYDSESLQKGSILPFEVYNDLDSLKDAFRETLSQMNIL